MLAGDPKFAQIIPISIEIELPGGQAEIQVYVGGGIEPPEAPSDRHAKYALELSKSGDDNGAIAAFKSALEENPDHTLALINLAAELKKSGDIGGARAAAMKAATIEPNFLLYQRAAISYLANEEDDKRELIETVTRAIEASNITSALAVEAEALIESNPARAVELLEQAIQKSPDDPDIAMSLAFTIARTEAPKEALPHLLMAAQRAKTGLSKACYLNAALCEPDPARAVVFLAMVMGALDVENGGKDPPDLLVELPGPGIWMSKGVIREKALSATIADLVGKIAMSRDKNGSLVPQAQRLAALYRKAALDPRLIKEVPHPDATPHKSEAAGGFRRLAGWFRR